MRSTLIRLAAGSVLVLALGGCPELSAGSVVSVTIEGGDRSTSSDGTLALTATVVTTGNLPDTVYWTSSDAAVASIDGDGAVEALAPGATTITATSTADANVADTITLTVNPLGILGWTRQFGTASNDVAYGVATGGDGHVYTAGRTFGGLDDPNAGGSDAFVRSYDRDGALRWTDQFGTASDDRANGVATGATGGVYLAGDTEGALGGANAGMFDGFVRAYDGDGNPRWTRQFGTSSHDFAHGVAASVGGAVYVVGYTAGALEGASEGLADAFVRAYDDDGAHLWTRQFGTSDNDVATAVATDADGNVYVTGYTFAIEGPNAGTIDAFARSYDPDGDLRWAHQFGTAGNDSGVGIATDSSGNVYVAGHTTGDLEGTNAGLTDAFVRSFDRDGVLRWTRQFGTVSNDNAHAIATAPDGRTYVAGRTFGTLVGVSAGGQDAFVRSFDRDGTLRWTRQFGTVGADDVQAIATGAYGFVYAAGRTEGSLDGLSAGADDAYVRAYGH